jgi:uncharacterized OsmC-like protein
VSPNRVKLIRSEEGTYKVPFNYGQMKDLIITNSAHDFSNTHLLAAAALICISGSMEYELGILKQDARYKELESSIRWRYGKDESGRRIIDSMEINVNVEVPDELRSEFSEVVKEHMDHGCLITRSLKRGFPIKLNITEI